MLSVFLENIKMVEREVRNNHHIIMKKYLWREIKIEWIFLKETQRRLAQSNKTKNVTNSHENERKINILSLIEINPFIIYANFTKALAI